MGNTEYTTSESQIQLSKNQLTKALEKGYGSFLSAMLEPMKNAAMYVLNMPDVSPRAMENIIRSRTDIHMAIQSQLMDGTKPQNLVNGELQQIAKPEEAQKAT